MSYAEPADLVPDYLDAAPPDAARLLRRASADVDRALLTAVYDTTDPAVIAALKRATCEQVAGEVTERASGGGIAGFTIGRINVTRSGAAPSSSTARVNGLHPAAWSTLLAAGLTGHAIRGIG